MVPTTGKKFNERLSKEHGPGFLDKLFVTVRSGVRIDSECAGSLAEELFRRIAAGFRNT